MKRRRAGRTDPARPGESAPPGKASPPAAAGRRRAPALAVEFLGVTLTALLATWIAFGPATTAGFVSDDINAIVENEWVVGDFDPVGIATHYSWWGSARADSAGYRPAATLSFAIQHQLSGADVRSFRLVNFVLNALCAGLLFLLARRLGLTRQAAGAAALVFAVLPIHSEAVIWIVGRAELGAAIGFLLAALACLAYRDGASWPQLVVAAVCVAVGMAFKENAVTVLAAPAIYRLALDRGATVPWRRDVAATVALVVGAAACGAARLAAPQAAGLAGQAAAEISLLDNPLAGLDPATRLLGALSVLGRYVSRTVWPASLSVDYSYDALAIGEGFRANADSLVAVVFLAGAAWLAFRGPGRRDVAATGLLLGAAAYSIVSNTVFVLGTICGERLFFLPTAGLCLALAAAADPLWTQASPSRRGRPWWRTGSTIAGGVVLLVAAAATMVDRQRSLDWKTPRSLFEAAVEALPGSARAHMELGSAYGNEGRVDQALDHFRRALAIKPDYAAAAYNQGNALARAGRYDDAAAAYRQALSSDPRLTRAWRNLALTERLRGRHEAWLEALAAAVESAPASTTLRSELGEALLAAGRYEEALAVYDALIAGGEQSATSWFNRGVARHHLGGCADAVDDYRRAAASEAAPAATFRAAAGCLRELGRADEAAAMERAGGG